ncbi:hypothetical protein MWU53_12890 [Aliiroseovarius sp. S1123]|jgi:hypothetical protein|uniref:hypothetical protein n=1 Tax=unclassified Aliiroseovarius TaxID=2623558 RepID=UPI001FF2D41F|nr:hypothetical protein [Aliiroseovarius sp. S1123]MCK0171957.1 hypothetical protein [Aliiroseovarius sp. S1123]
MISLIARLGTRRGLTVLIITYLVVFGAILTTLGQLMEVSGGFGILDFDQSYSKDRVREVFGSYGEYGFSLYRRIQLLDVLNPALYSLIASVLTYLLWKGRGVDWLCLTPLLGGIGDYAENVTLFFLARGYPQVSDGLVSVSSTLSLIKNGLLILGVLPLLFGFVRWGIQRLRRS